MANVPSFVVPATPLKPAIPVRRLATPVARRFYQICLAMVADSLAEAGLTPLQYGTLTYLNKETGEPGIDQVGLAARLGIDRNNVGVILAELEARELLERRVDPADKRARRGLRWQRSPGEQARRHRRGRAWACPGLDTRGNSPMHT